MYIEVLEGNKLSEINRENNSQTRIYEMSHLIYKSHQVSQSAYKTISIISTPKTIGALHIASNLLEPLKYKFIAAYAAKVAVDMFKETGIQALLVKGAN